jgi:glycerol-1-phosphate dehydrogenase [NAD(P)+]
MTEWERQILNLIDPAVARSESTHEVLIGKGTLREAGEMAVRLSDKKRCLVMADTAGFEAAGKTVLEVLRGSGFDASALVLPNVPLPKASVEEAEPFRSALANDPGLLPVSVGSGVINDLVKYAAFRTEQRYITVATAASMDGYTSAGAPLATGGFKITIPTRAPMAMLADLDVLTAAPADMNGWGFGDLAGKMPAGGDWILADALGVEPIDADVWSLVQDHLRGWLSDPSGIANGTVDAVAGLFVGLTAVGFAMEFHGSSRPASGADHQIAHMWEMEGLAHKGEKVSHGAAVAVGCMAAMALFDWLLEQEIGTLDIDAVVARSPDLAARTKRLRLDIADPRIAEKAESELAAKHAEPDLLRERLERLVSGWPGLRERLSSHLLRSAEMKALLDAAGAPALPHQIGITPEHLLRTMRAAGYIRRRYTILDLLSETGLSEAAFAAVLPKLASSASRAAE